ncbi:MAG: hypothetical protein E6Q90_12220 [Actinobacteria bacterium]|nr:MAG: hypothetical protein E6Q90_12220 [Actinomycetota bacterium]
MSTESRQQAEAALREVAERYAAARAALAEADAAALEAAYRAKVAGLSQHDIARVMGDEWARDHNPQYPPTLNLQRPAD